MNPRKPWYWMVILFVLFVTPAMGQEKLSQPQPLKSAVDRNIFEAGEQLCSQVSEWAGPTRYMAGHEGGEDVIRCDWWKLGKVNDEPVIIWKCKDGNSKWAVLCGNDRWWHGELD